MLPEETLEGRERCLSSPPPTVTLLPSPRAPLDAGGQVQGRESRGTGMVPREVGNLPHRPLQGEIRGEREDQPQPLHLDAQSFKPSNITPILFKSARPNRLRWTSPPWVRILPPYQPNYEARILNSILSLQPLPSNIMGEFVQSRALFSTREGLPGNNLWGSTAVS